LARPTIATIGNFLLLIVQHYIRTGVNNLPQADITPARAVHYSHLPKQKGVGMPELQPGQPQEPLDPQAVDMTTHAINEVIYTLGGEPTTEPVGAAAMQGVGSEGVIADPHLASLLTQSVEAVGPERLERLLRLNEPFNVTRPRLDESGRWADDEQNGNRTFLTELLACAEAAKGASVSPEQLEDLVHTVLKDVVIPDIIRSSDMTAPLTRALQVSAAAGEQLTPEDLAKLKLLIETGAPEGVVRESLGAYAAAREAGLSFDDSTNLVLDYLRTANIRVAYDMWRFNEALHALNVATVDPDLIKEVFGVIEGQGSDTRNTMYTDLKDSIELLCPLRGITPAELLSAIAIQLRAGLSFDQAINRVIERGGGLPSADETVSVIIPSEQQERHFPTQEGPLRHAVHPYQTRRSLNDGLRDLERLTGARRLRAEVVAEGRWAFDPQSGTWYSMGGSTTYIPERAAVQHRGLQYDLGQLSPSPYVFRIHPEDYAVRGDRFGFVFPTAADYRDAARSINGAASPIQQRSFISHPIGITEFTYPHDTARIAEVAEVFEGVKDELFGAFGHHDGIMYVANQIGQERLARIMVDEVNSRLPEGFYISLHPRGVDLEEVIRQERQS
jgi:hypothetical protein